MKKLLHIAVLGLALISNVSTQGQTLYNPAFYHRLPHPNGGWAGGEWFAPGSKSGDYEGNRWETGLQYWDRKSVTWYVQGNQTNTVRYEVYRNSATGSYTYYTTRTYPNGTSTTTYEPFEPSVQWEKSHYECVASDGSMGNTVDTQTVYFLKNIVTHMPQDAIHASPPGQSVTLLWGVKTVKETCAGSDGPDTVNQSTKIYNKEAETYFSQPMNQKRVLSLSAGMYLY